MTSGAKEGAVTAALLCVLAIQAGGLEAAARQPALGDPPPAATARAAPAATAVSEGGGTAPGRRPPWPDVEVVDQDGRRVRFYSDLVRGKRVAINFVFTTCTTICPPMGANFERLQALLGARAGADVRLLSISVDPLTDTPERLKAWGARFHAGPGWTLLTGPKEELDRLLKAMGVFTADPASHAPILLLGDDRTGRWTRAYGLAPPAKIVQLLDGLSAAAASTAPAANTAPAAGTVVAAARSQSAPAEQTHESASHHYFTDVELIDQDGKPRRLYSDLLAGKTVVVDSFFTSCTGSCPAVAATLARIQAALGDRLGRDVVLLSLSVDPQTDTPARLKEYAARLGARSGWYFLTGNKENVDLALRKLGQYSERKEDHTNLLIVGNERTGLWKKVFGLAKPEEVLAIVQSVLDDRGAPGTGG
ncbi:MAG TPA: SCO family protein [Thermoanaerobaculia bacterium]